MHFSFFRGDLPPTSLRPLLFSGWPKLIKAQNSLTYRGPLPLSCSCGREHIPFIGLSCDSTFRTSSSVGFGAGFWSSCVYGDSLERSFVSLRDGDRPDLTLLGDSPLLSPSLASAPNSLRSTYEARKAGTLTKASLVDIAPSDSIAAYFSAPHSSSFGSPSRSCLCSLRKVSRVPLSGILPAGSTACTTSSTPTVSSLRARSCRMKRPLVLLRPRGDASSVVTGAPPGSLSARCVVFTVSPCLIIFSPFFCPLIIDPAGRAVPAGPIRVCYAGWTVVFWLVFCRLLRWWIQLLVRVLLATKARWEIWISQLLVRTLATRVLVYD